MPSPDTQFIDPQLLEVAQRAATEAGQIAARHFHQGVEAVRKAEHEPSYNLVTVTDVQCEACITSILGDAFPSHAILGEESAGDAEANAALVERSEHLWVIDPIDGTNNFAHKLPHFAISIAYYHRGVAQLGVVFNPIRNDRYHAIRGSGAFHNGAAIRVSPAKGLNEVIIGTGFYYDRGAMMRATLDAIADLFAQQIHGIRRFGTASLDLCQVAAGQFGGFFEFQLSPWDYAAGQVILHEAGGTISNCLGQPLGLAKSSVLASNGALHEAILQQVAPHFRKLSNASK
jgi:myo-inositol-1(or 4)-monophosphatase